MSHLLQNFLPTIFSLIGVSVLVVRYPTFVRKWRESQPHWPEHVSLRLALGLCVLLVLSFVVSSLLVTGGEFVWANTIICFTLFALYLIKVVIDLKKYSSTDSSHSR